ncbi:hypothetical protein OO013_05010 [Mangrovivirga sp. M17]|uniref:Gasdermin bGSDM n=1 Tax=Mangrovivirga halotolerans TaxID=2993936 RepID=A0ABT3RPM2_9BACT|nr:hypothetical protein [Mangrovivirga halotolerans]MCX2743212.1 hypothetical protein [Mangrovivirga halotolerans]
MNLKNDLRDVGYDLIDSPIRNHKPLQLWLKKTFDVPELYYENVKHAFKSDTEIEIIEDQALRVNYNQQQQYKFNIGITVLEQLLVSLGLGNLSLSNKFKSGSSVSISYGKSKTLTIPSGIISRFFSMADFQHPNPELIRNANRNNILIITGVLSAKDLKATIVTNKEIDSSITGELADMAEGNASFQKTSDNVMEMYSEGNAAFPIAVKANRLDFDKGEYSDIKLITDNRSFF